MYIKTFNNKLDEDLNSLSYLREKTIKSLIKNTLKLKTSTVLKKIQNV